MEGHAQVEYLKTHGGVREGTKKWLLPQQAFALKDEEVVKIVSFPRKQMENREHPFFRNEGLPGRNGVPAPPRKMARVEYLRNYSGKKEGDTEWLMQATAFARKDAGAVKILELRRVPHDQHPDEALPASPDKGSKSKGKGKS